MTAPKSNLIDRDRAAAEKHTGRPAIASRTPIAPMGNHQHELPGIATIATDPATGGGAQTEPGCLHRAAQPLQGGRAAHPTVTAGAALGRVEEVGLWMNRRQRRQPPRPTAPAHRL